MSPQSQSQESSKSSSDQNKRPRSRWLAAGVGMVLFVSAVVYLGYLAIWGSEVPPRLDVVVESVERTGDDYLLTFSAKNRGGETAAAVSIIGELSRNGRVIEQSTVTMNYIPAHSEGEGGLFFEHDPATGTLRLRATGYQRP